MDFMQRQQLKQPSILSQLVLICGVGLLLGVISVWLPPYYVLVGVAGIIYVVVAWLWPEIAIIGILLFTSTIFNIYAYPSIPIGVGNLIISDILLVVLFGIIFLRVMIRSSSYFIHTPLDIPLIAFYGAAILATGIGIFKSRITFNQALGEVRVINFYLIFFVVTNLIRNDKQLRRLLNGIFVLAFLVGLVMVAQYMIGEQIKILPGRVETLGTAGVTDPGVTRIIPPGQSLVLVVFISQAVLLIFGGKPSGFLIRFFLAGVTGVAVVLTFTRNYWGAFSIALFIVGILVSIRDKVKYANIVLLVAIIGASVVTPFLSIKEGKVEKLINGTMIRLSTLFDPNVTQEESLRFRYIENEYVLPQIIAHPFFGLGLGANYRPKDYRLDYSKPLSESLTWYIHNGHYWVMVKTGLIGYLFFLWFFLRSVKRGFQNWKRIPDPFLKGIVLSFAATILSLQFSVFVAPVFTNSWWSPVIGVMLGVSEVIVRLNHNHALDSQTFDKMN
jgi:hypothetical protein